MSPIETPLSETYSLYATSSGYIDLQKGGKYIVVYYILGYKSTRRFKGAEFAGYDIVMDKLIFLTPRGHQIAIRSEMFITCLEVK